MDPVERKLVLSMRQKPRPAIGDQGDVSKYATMLKEVREPRPFKWYWMCVFPSALAVAAVKRVCAC